MNMPDINIVKTLTLDLKKSFDKGEIDKLYDKMYTVAKNIATEEAKEKNFSMPKTSDGTPYLLMRRILNYKNRRIKFHLNQMHKLLELYAKSKSVNSQT